MSDYENGFLEEDMQSSAKAAEPVKDTFFIKKCQKPYKSRTLTRF